MAYSELIKNFQAIRSYMRQFYVYGFKSRTQYDAKSARSYDDARRRIDSWLGEYMSFHQSAGGRAQFLSVDGRTVAHNPLYQAFKTKTFTGNDILLHFYLLDCIGDTHWSSFREIVDCLYEDYLEPAEAQVYLDESTIRNKLKEYVQAGLLEQKKDGKSFLYQRCSDMVDAASWRDAVDFFAEMAPLGVAGSYLQDRDAFAAQEGIFCFKHHYFLHTLDSQILYEIFMAMRGKNSLELRIQTRRQQAQNVLRVYPVRIYSSTQTGRQYLLAYVYGMDKLSFFRLDAILEVKQGQTDEAYERYERSYEKLKGHLWGVSLGENRKIDHLEMVIRIEDGEEFIVRRLEREKRNGAVRRIDDHTCLYETDTHDATELLPWIRTFIGRIQALSCSNPEVEALFWADLEEMEKQYLGGADHAV